MEQLKHSLSPIADLLPPGVRDFLEGGGWWILLGVLGVVAVLLLWALVDKTLRVVFGRKRMSLEESDREFYEDLAKYPSPEPLPRNRRLTVYHLPVRLRLVVLAAVGAEADPDTNAVDQLLDRIVPGLGGMAVLEHARVRVWSPQLTQQGFAAAFRRRTRRPEPEGESSHWVLAAGRAQAGQQAVLLGLALWAEEPTSIGRLALEPYQWLDVLRIKTVEG
jgi:hypothetical protein